MRHDSWRVLLFILTLAGDLRFELRTDAQDLDLAFAMNVLPDTEGPAVVEARGDNTTWARRGAKTVAITFSEGLNHSATNFSNYAVYPGTNFVTRLSFTNVVYNFSQDPKIWLFMSDARWVYGNDYFVVINNVADTRGNFIAPNIRVPVCWDVAGSLRCSPLPSDPPAEQLKLSVKRQGTNQVVSWPSGFGGYSLQYNAGVGSGSGLQWLAVSNQANPYRSTLDDGVRLFRLEKR